jgi:hypothetical protein
VSQESRGEKPAASAPEEPSAEPPAESATAVEPDSAPVTPQAETESRKKFTKSYGA